MKKDQKRDDFSKELQIEVYSVIAKYRKKAITSDLTSADYGSSLQEVSAGVLSFLLGVTNPSYIDHMLADVVFHAKEAFEKASELHKGGDHKKVILSAGPSKEESGPLNQDEISKELQSKMQGLIYESKQKCIQSGLHINRFYEIHELLCVGILCLLLFHVKDDCIESKLQDIITYAKESRKNIDPAKKTQKIGIDRIRAKTESQRDNNGK